MDINQHRSRYNLRSRKNDKECGKITKSKNRQSTNSNIKSLIKFISPSNIQCNLRIKPVIPKDSHLNFNCMVKLQDINININRQNEPVTPVLVERNTTDNTQGVTGFEGFTKNIDVLNNLCGDGSLSAFHKCTKERCVTCSMYFKPTDYFASSVTHRLYKCNNREWPEVVNCNTSNIIYLLTCNCCNFQYVGETIVRQFLIVVNSIGVT